MWDVDKDSGCWTPVARCLVDERSMWGQGLDEGARIPKQGQVRVPARVRTMLEELIQRIREMVRSLPAFAYKKQFFEKEPGAPLDAYQRLLCGGLAGITSVTFTYPLDIVRTRLSIQSASFESLKRDAGEKLPGMWGIMVSMYKNEGGFFALYRGIVPTVTGVAPYVGLNFMVYEMARTKFTVEGQKDPSAVGKLAAGAVSGAVAQTCTYPFDVLRRRFQINTMSGMGYQYSGIGDAIRNIVKTEGIRGLYKGIVPNLLKVAPSMASSWLSYEITRDLVMGK